MIVTVKKKMATSVVAEHIRAARIIPVLAYCEDEQLFLMEDSALGFGFLCTPLCYTDEKIQERINGFLNADFPPGTTLQFTLLRSPDIAAELHQIAGLRDEFKDTLLASTMQERIQFLQKHTLERLAAKTDKGTYDIGLIQDLKLCVSCKTPIQDNQPTVAELHRIAQLRVQVESALRTAELRPTPLTAARYLRFMSTLFNWGSEVSWRYGATAWEQDKPICEQIFDYGVDLTVSGSGLRLGAYHVKLLSAKKLPQERYFGDAIADTGDQRGGALKLSEHYMITATVFFPPTERTKNTLERKRQFVVNQAYGPMLKFVPVLADKKVSFDTLYESVNEGAKPVRVSYSLAIFAPTAERIEAAATAARTLWRTLQFDLMEDKFVTLPVFLNALPLCTDRAALQTLFRYKTMTTTQAAVMLPLFGEWKGTGTYHAALLSRNGQIMSLSLHDSHTNKNLVIAAESGSGKSFLINELIFSYLSEGAQIWVVDAGKSYQKLCELLRGDFVHFGEESAVCLNPFELVECYEDEEDALLSLVCAMASAKGLLDEWQVSTLKQTLATLWKEKGRSMKVDDIAARCQESPDQRLNDVGQQLFAFTSQGNYGRFFGRQNNIAFQNQFTVLELDELQGRKHLRQVVLLQLIYQIQQEVFLGERNRKKIIIIDEAWDLLKEGEVSVFMEHAYRKFRKYGGSVVIATQSINDLYENPVGRAIAENSASMYLLGQTEEAIESVKRSGRLALSEAEFKLLKTVHTVKDVYSELFIKSKTGSGIGRLVVGHFQKLLYSTDPADVHAIEQGVKQGLDVAAAIQAVRYSRQQGNGRCTG